MNVLQAIAAAGLLAVTGAHGQSTLPSGPQSNVPAQRTTPAATGSQPATQTATQTKAPAQTAPLQLHSLDPDARPDPFPPVDAKYFTADSPSVATVDAFMRVLLGYEPNRLWRVEAIEKTPAPGITRVLVYISDRNPGAKVQTYSFLITPDGNYAIAPGNGITPFGAKPYAAARDILRQRAFGPSEGAASKDLQLVEFTDLQCTKCKDAQPVMKRLAQDFPGARIVFQPLPQTEIHPYAQKAAAWGVCIAKSSNAAYQTYANAVYATQAALTDDTWEETLKAAVVKANLDPALVESCSTTSLATDNVAESVKLAADLGVAETPTLMVNGRPLPLGIPYDTLKQIIVFQASLDGVPAAAAGAPETHSLVPR